MISLFFIFPGHDLPGMSTACLGDGRTHGRTDGRRPLGKVATFEIGGVGSILLTNTTVLYGPDTPDTAKVQWCENLPMHFLLSRDRMETNGWGDK